MTVRMEVGMGTAAKRRGAEAEIWPVQRAWLAGLDSERLTLVGAEDEGDWWLRTQGGRLWVMQSKAVRNLSITRALREARKQAENYAKHRGLDFTPQFGVIVRPIGMGQKLVDEWPVVQTYGQLLERG